MANLLFNPANMTPVTRWGDQGRPPGLIEFFEAKGNAAMKAEFHSYAWYADFLERNAKLGTFARSATPAEVGELLG